MDVLDMQKYAKEYCNSCSPKIEYTRKLNYVICTAYDSLTKCFG